MLEFLSAQWGTVLAALVLLGLVCAVIVTMIRNRKKGKSACGCGCVHCAMDGACHSKKTHKQGKMAS